MSKSESIDLIIKSPSKEELGDKVSNLAFSIEEGFEGNKEEWFITATNKKREVRSLAQNALGAIYYTAIADFSGLSVEDVKINCRIDFGLQALLEQSAIDDKDGLVALKLMKKLRVVKFRWMIRQDKITVMDGTPCTSLMSKKVFASYMKQIELFYIDKGLVLQSINEGLRNKAYDV